MASNNKIEFQVGFSTDESGLKHLKNSLNEILQMAHENSWSDFNSGEQQAIKNAEILKSALEKSFNADLGVTNISRLNNELKKSGTTIDACRASFKNMGSMAASSYYLLGSQILSTNLKIKESNKLLDKMAITMANTVRFGISSSIFNNMTGSLEKAVNYVEKLDKSLTDIRIVADKSAKQMQEFAKYANEAAKGLGATTLDYTNASLIYYQQGLAEQEIQERTQVTLEMANVLGESASQVSDYMTAIWNNFDDGSKSLEYYGDVIVELGAKTASSAQEISEGLSKFASVADTVGLSYEYATSALATVVAETRQSADVVGTAFKTLFARIQDLELGESLDDGTTLGSYSQALEKVGINIKNQKGQLKDMDEILQEMGNKWKSLSGDQQVALAQNVAGTRQYTQLVALMDNWDEFNKNLDYAIDSTGTLQEQQAIYLESTDAKLNKLKTTAQGLYATLINKDDLNDGIDALTDLVEVFDNLLSSFGSGTSVIAGLGAVLSGLFSKQIAQGVVGFSNNLRGASANADLLRLKLSQLDMGTFKATNGEDVTPGTAREAGYRANYESQLKNTEAILSIRSAITQEEQNELTKLQSEVALMEQEKAQIEFIAENKMRELKIEDDLLSMSTFELQDRKEEIEYQQKHNKAASQLYNTYNKMVQINDALGAANDKNLKLDKTKITNLEKIILDENKILKLGETQKQNLKEQVEELKKQAKIINNPTSDEGDKVKAQKKAGIAVEKIRGSLTNGQGVYKKYKAAKDQMENGTPNEELEEEIKLVEQLLGLKEKENQIDNKQQSIDDAIAATKNNMILAGTVNTLTSSLSLAANAWMSLNSMVEVWNNEDMSFGEKLSQSFMTLSMTVPMILSNFSNLKQGIKDVRTGLEAFNILMEEGLRVQENQNKIAELSEAVKERAILLQTEENLTEEQKTDLKNKDILIEKISQELQKEGISQTTIETAVLNAENKTLGENTAGQIANNVTKKSSITLIKQYVKQKLAEIAADKASMVAKLGWVGIVLTAIAALTALIVSSKKADKRREEEIKTLEKSISKHQDLTKQYEDEAKAIDTLVSSYEEILKARKEGSITVDDARQQIYELCNQYDLESLKIQALTGDYENMTEAMRATQQEKYSQAADENKKTLDQTLEKGKLEALNKQGKFKRMANHSDHYLAGLGGLYGDEKAFTESDQYQDLFIGGVNRYSAEAELDYDAIIKRAAKDADFYGEIARIAKEDGSELAKAIKKVLDDSEETIEQTKEELTSYENNLKQSIALDAVQKVTDSKTYIEQIKEASKKALEEGLFDTEEEATQWAQSAMGAFDEVKQYINTSTAYLMIEAKLSDSNTSEGNELLRQLANGEISDEMLAYLIIHLEYSDDGSVTAKEVRNLISEGKEEVDFLVNVHAVNDVQEVLDNIYKNDGEISNQDISSLVTNKDFMESIDMTEQQFRNMCEYNTQYAVDLVGNYFDSITNKVRAAKGNLDDLKAQQTQLAEQKSQDVVSMDTFSVDDEGTSVVETQSKLGVEEAAASAQESYANLLQFIQDNPISDAMNFQDVSNLLEKVKNGTGNLTDEEKDLFETLSDQYGITKDMVKSWGSAEKKQQAYADQESYLANEIENTNDALDTQLTKINRAKQKFNEVNQEVDNLQKTYSSLKDVTDQYNEDGVLTIDNLQTLLAMTPEELSYLDLKEGKMSINTERMKEDTIAKLESMKASILAEGQEKLLTIAQGEAGDSAAYAAIKQQYLKDTLDGVEGAAQKAKTALASYNQTLQSMSNLTGEKKALADAVNADVQKRISLIDNTIGGIKSGKISFDKAMTGKSSKSSQKEDKELIDEEIDAYHKWEQQIKACTNALDELQERQEHLKGKQLIKNLEAQTAALRKQVEAQKNLNGQYKAQAEYEKSRLIGYGVGAQFDSTGNISNYNQMMQNAQDQYNAAIKAYNSSKTDANEKAVENAKNVYDDIKQTVSNYEEAIEGVQKAQQAINELMQNQADVALAKLEAEWDLELQIDTHDAERKIKNFIKELNKDFTRATEDWKENFNSAFDDFSNGKLTEDVNGQISKMSEIMSWMDNVQARSNAEGEYEFVEGDMFTSASDAAEYLIDLEEELEDLANDLKDAYEDAWDAYVEGIDQAVEEFGRLNDIIDKNIDRMEKYKDLMELSYDNTYSTENQIDYYSTQMANQLTAAKNRQIENELWAQQFNEIAKQNNTSELQFDANGFIDQTKVNIAEMDEAQQKMYEQMISNEDKILDSYVERAKLAKEIKDLQLEASTKAAAKAMFGTTDIDYQKQQWEDQLKWQDRYYDGQERIYQLESLGNKYDTAISDTKSLKTQEKLLKVKEQELKYLKEKDNLSKDEIALAEKRYELTMAEIALEEAQNNKNTMKLTRNEEGNWSYQYVADEDDVASKQQDVIDKTYEYYEAAKEAYQNAVSYSYEIYETYTERYMDIMNNTSLSEEERAARLEELNKNTSKNIAALGEETTSFILDTTTATSLLVNEAIETGNVAIADLTEKQKELYQMANDANLADLQETRGAMENENSLLKQQALTCLEETVAVFSTDAAKVVATWQNQSSVIQSALLDAARIGQETISNYQQTVNESAAAIGLSLQEPQQSFMAIRAVTEQARIASQLYAQQTASGLGAARSQLMQIKTAWDQVKASILQAVSQMQQYINRTQQAVVACNNLVAAQARAAAAQASAKSSSSSSSGGSGKSPSNNKTVTLSTYTGSGKNTIYNIYDNDGSVSYRWGLDGKDFESSFLRKKLKNEGYTTAIVNGKTITLATGGYTGEWSDGNKETDNGKLAWLHQKELVLNETDTKNILDAVKSVRDLNVSSIDDAIMSGIANMIVKLSTNSIGNIPNSTSTNTSNNTFNITAEFPNANDVDEIREAIMSLPNLASQYLARK